LDGKFDRNIARELFKIGLPLVPTFLIYWVYNSTDRIMITNMLGTGQLGIYSIGSRVAQISQVIYLAFAGGWQYFAFSTMRDEDQVDLVSRVFEYLGIISFLAFLAIVPFNNLILPCFSKETMLKARSFFRTCFFHHCCLCSFKQLGTNS